LYYDYSSLRSGITLALIAIVCNSISADKLNCRYIAFFSMQIAVSAFGCVILIAKRYIE